MGNEVVLDDSALGVLDLSVSLCGSESVGGRVLHLLGTSKGCLQGLSKTSARTLLALESSAEKS